MNTLKAIQDMSKAYTSGTLREPYLYEGIAFYPVGHNASHSFSLGVDDEGVVWSYSSGEGDWDAGLQEYGWSQHVCKVGTLENVGYVGHF